METAMHEWNMAAISLFHFQALVIFGQDLVVHGHKFFFFPTNATTRAPYFQQIKFFFYTSFDLFCFPLFLFKQQLMNWAGWMRRPPSAADWSQNCSFFIHCG